MQYVYVLCLIHIYYKLEEKLLNSRIKLVILFLSLKKWLINTIQVLFLVIISIEKHNLWYHDLIISQLCFRAFQLGRVVQTSYSVEIKK